MDTRVSGYTEISQTDLETAKGNAWSIESMEGHDTAKLILTNFLGVGEKATE